MNYHGFGRGRGFGPQGVRAKGPFVRPCFPPFRHGGPPRPGCPGLFMPRNPNNFYQPQLRGNPQFRPRGRGKKFYNYDDHFAGLNKLSTNPECEETVMSSSAPSLQLSNSEKIENNEIDCMPQLLPDSEVKQQQQDITEKTDQLKQNPCFSKNEDCSGNTSLSDVPCDIVADECIENEDIFELNNESPELYVKCNDLEDINRISTDNLELDALQHVTKKLSNANNINNDIILERNEDKSQLKVISSHQVTDLENIRSDDNKCVEAENSHKSDDGSHNLEQSDLCEDNNLENGLSQTDLQCQYNTPEDNIIQDQCNRQQDRSEEIEVHLETDAIQKENMSEAPILHDMLIPYDSVDQNTLQENISQDEERPVTNLETRKTISSFHVDDKNLNNNNCSLLQPDSTNAPILNNPILHNQNRLPQIQESSFHSGPPELSPHTDVQLPIDFDPSTPPPILLKQDQPLNLSSFPVYNLPPIFNPAEPPPNMRHLLKPNVVKNIPPNLPLWNINEKQMPGAFNNMEIHRDLSISTVCTSQQLPLEMPSQGNVFLSPNFNTIKYSPMFPLMRSNHHGIKTNIPIPVEYTTSPIQQVTHNIYSSSVSSPEILSFPDSNLDINKDDGLSDIEEAMKFAKQMTNMIEKKEEDSNPGNCNLITVIEPISDVNSISLPPGKPQVKSKIPRKEKQNDESSEDIVVEKLTSPDNLQDTGLKPKDESLLNEQERPKVAFNLNNKMIKVNTNWGPTTSKTKGPKKYSKIRNERMKNKMLQKKLQSTAQTDKADATFSVSTKKVENFLNPIKETGQISTKDRNNLENTLSFMRQNAAISRKKLEKNVEQSPRSSVLPYDVQRSLRSRIEKLGNPNTVTSWKNKIVNRFLKMSKNEIYNMVNNTSLRKFDVIMKRLVREKRSMLSLEMRHAQDEKMKRYDQQEFIKQLNAMLEPGATVDITNLPTEFIHHLNEVLQLDIPLSNNEELASSTTSIGQSNHSEGTSNVTNPMIQSTECASKVPTLSDIVDQECMKKDNVSKMSHTKDTQVHNIKINDFTVKDDAHSTKSNKSNASSRLSALQHDLDDIFSEVTRKNQTPMIASRKDCSVRQRAKKSDDGALLKNKEISWEEDRTRRTETCIRWIEKCDKWKMKEQEDPLAYRNLTKEEWEAKYGMPAISTEQSSAIISTTIISTTIPTTSIPTTTISTPTIPVALSTVLKQAAVSDGRTSPNIMHMKNFALYPRRRHSSESSKHSYAKHKTIEDDKHKQHRRHSDERRQPVENSNERHNKNRDNSSSSSSSSSSSNSSSNKSNSSKSSSDSNDTNNVTKLLRVIKEKEKVAKKMSLNETIRDEVNAEIERERKQKSKKSRKSHKNGKSRKEKRTHHKKNKKQRKKLLSSSESTSQEENNEEETMTKLLTESEIKKEIMEGEVVVKKEANIGQEENNIRYSEPANTSSHRTIMKNTVASLPTESLSRSESASSAREMSITDSMQSYIEDTASTTSPSQLKTKAQLKQMPETTNVANKISLNTETGIPDNDSVINVSKQLENSKKHHEAINNYSEDEPELPSLINQSANRNNTTDITSLQTPCDKVNDNPLQLDATTCVSIDLPTNITNTPGDKEVSSSPVLSLTNVTSASSVLNIPITNTTSQKQGSSKKIDIKTYYERTMQRRISKQNEPKKLSESSVAPQALSSAPKAVEPDVRANRTGSIKDPRLFYLRKSIALPCSSTNENSPAQESSAKNIQLNSQQTTENISSHRANSKYQAIEKSQVAESVLKHFDDNVDKKIDRHKPKDRKSFTVDTIGTNANALSDVPTSSTAALLKIRNIPEIEENLADKKRTTIPPDSKRFKHIRSEGSKELKLKEIAKVQKKKTKVALKSINVVSTIVHHAKAEAENMKKTKQEEEDNNIIDTSRLNKIEIKQTTAQSTSPCANEANQDNTETEPAKFSSENTGDDNNEVLPRDIDHTEERSFNLELAELKDIKKDVTDTANIKTSQCLLSLMVKDEEACNKKCTNNTTSNEIASQEKHGTEEVPHDMVESAAFEICLQTEISDDIGKINKENLPLSIKIQRFNTTKDTKLISNDIKDKEFDKRNLLENTNSSPVSDKEHNTSGSSKMDMISRLDNAEDVTSSMNKAATTDAGGSLCEKTTQLSMASCKNSEEQKATEQNISSPDSVGSPFKGFLQDSIISFEPALFSLDINEINADKEFTAEERSNDKTDTMTNKDRNGKHAEKCASGEALTSTLCEKEINTGESNETEQQLVNEDRYTTDIRLAVGESVFINVEEIQCEDGAKDLASKLTSATDPSLTDALDTAGSDEALKLPEILSAENLHNQVYLEGTTVFDNKDDTQVHFPDHQQSIQYDITPAIDPGTTITSCSDFSHVGIHKPTQSKFEFDHISPDVSSANDDFVRASMNYLPKTLNIPTKAALKVSVTSSLAKSTHNTPTPTEGAERLEKTQQQSETYLLDGTLTQQLNVQNTKISSREIQNNTTVTTQEAACIDEISPTQCDASDKAIQTFGAEQSVSATSIANMENNLHDNMQRNPVVEPRKIKDLDALIQKKTQKKSEKSKNAMFKSRKRESAILHKLESRRMKYRSKWPHMKNLVKKLKLRQSERPGSSTREIILARMMEIDVQMHELTKEKLKLHEILQKDMMLAGNSASNSNMALRMHENDTIPAQPGAPLTLRSLLIQDIVTDRMKSNKTPSPSKQSSTPSKQPAKLPSKQLNQSKQAKKTLSHSSGDDEIVRCTQKVKTPVIRWKKIPWLEQVPTQPIEEEHEKENHKIEETVKKQMSTTICKKINDSIDTPENIVQKFQSNDTVDHDDQGNPVNTKINKKTDDVSKTSKSTTWSDKSANDQLKPRDFVETETVDANRLIRESDIDKKSDGLVPAEAPTVNFQLPNILVHSTPEPAPIYSDDSTWNSLVQNTVFELHEKKKSTGLALLEETFKKELALSRKMKAIARKQKKKQLNDFLKIVNNLTVEEEELPLSKLYIKKLQQKRDLLDSLAQAKIGTISTTIDPVVLEKMDEVINAVAENRVEDLYETRGETRVSTDIPTTSNVSIVSQAEKHQFYVDAEANANADWPSVEKEAAAEISLQRQNSNDMPEADEPNCAFAIVNQSKVSLYDERNVEPDSSITPEESRYSSDCGHVCATDTSVLRSFDIKVSVPKTLIQNDFNLGLLQKFNDIQSNIDSIGLVGSTTNECTTNTNGNREGNRQCDEILQNTPRIAESAIVENEEDHNEEEGAAKSSEEDQHTVDANGNKHIIETSELQKQETTDSVSSARFVSQADTAKFEYSDVTENEDSGNVALNAYGKTAATDIEHNSISSDSATTKINTEQKKSDAESEQFSNDSIATKRDYQNVEIADAEEENRTNSESNSRTFEEIQNNEQCAGGPVQPNSVSEKSKESKTMLIEGKRILDYTSTSSSSNLSFDKSISDMKTAEETKKSVGRKRLNRSVTAVRRSSRYSNENMKPNKDDDNSNSSGQDLNIHERDLTVHHNSKSPTWAMRNEKIMNTKKNRATQKALNMNTRRTFVGAESETTGINDSMKSQLAATAEPSVSKDRIASAGRKRKQYTQWEMMNCKVMLVDYVATIPTMITEKTLKIHKPNEKAKLPTEIEVVHEKLATKSDDNNLVQLSTSHETEVDELEPVRTQYTVHKGPILDIKVFKNSFLAASEDGKIYRYNLMSNGILNIYKGHKSAVTCLLLYNSSSTNVNIEHIYSGSLDGTLRCFNIQTGALIKNPAQIHSSIQCMDEAWGVIFIGSKSGHVSRFNIKAGAIKGASIPFSDTSVLALKATNEGPRRILIVASRNQPISIRDAQTGLFLRTISGQKCHTVYSLMRHNNLIYCGTSSTSINVFDFTLGEQTIQYDAGVGIVCMRLYEQLLFAGCYDGNIYVFDTRNHKLVCSIPGPGNMLLSVEVVNNKIIAGSKDKRLYSWQMPPQVRALL